MLSGQTWVQVVGNDFFLNSWLEYFPPIMHWIKQRLENTMRYLIKPLPRRKLPTRPHGPLKVEILKIADLNSIWALNIEVFSEVHLMHD